MPDDRISSGQGDRNRIEVKETRALAFWTRELGIDAATLKHLVKRVGPSPEKVRVEIQAGAGRPRA